MKTFNKEKILKSNTVVHCSSRKQAIELLSWANSIGLEWNSEDSYINNDKWDAYKDEMCYNLNEGKYGSLKFFKEHGFNILEFEDIIVDCLISINKKYRTRDGRAVRILCIDKKDKTHPIVALVTDECCELEYNYTKNGMIQDTESKLDLVEIIPIHDKAIVRCWDNGDFVRHEKFYDAVNDCTFSFNGYRNGKAYDNYEIIIPEPKWAIETRENLKN